MKHILFLVRGFFLHRAFLPRRLLRYAAAELLFESGKLVPAPLRERMWRRALALNPHHVSAALQRASLLAARGDARVEAAFRDAGRAIENPQRTSASDLALTGVPHRIFGRLLRRDAAAQERATQALYDTLAQRYDRSNRKQFGQDESVETRRRTLAAEWDAIESEWESEKYTQAFAHAAPCIERGDFVSPFDALTWAERALAKENSTLAQECLEWAEQWLPEQAKVWELRGELARSKGNTARAEIYLERTECLRRNGIAVPDTKPGKLLLLLTEDHELWEERGTIPRHDVERLLVEKSAFAAEQFAPWTHMVEAGSALALLDWAAEQDAAWQGTRDAAYAHLRDQVKRGNDIQPHLHAFNLPSSSEFPYQVTADGLVLDKAFLLTAEERRKDFARAYAPRERVAAVAESVARLERIATVVDPNYRAVLWRSGQLEYGDDEMDREWSSVALLRAGLFADSDMGKKTFALGTLPRTAFFANLDEPFAARAGGELLQLPVTNNLEGDFLTDGRTLAEIAKQTGEALRDKPGVHVVTLLTHDKFINARRGGDEFRLDASYNEWAMIRAELDAWRAAGAEQVTARQAIYELLDDGAWRLTAWLCQARTLPTGVGYTIQLLGKGIMVSDGVPHWVLVTIPPYLRADVAAVRVRQGERELTVDQYCADHFWIRVTAREPEICCEFELRTSETVE